MFQVQNRWNTIQGGNQRLECSSKHNSKARQLSGVTASSRINAQCHTLLQADLLLSHAQFVMGQVWPICCNISTIKHQSRRQEAMSWGKNSLPRRGNVWDSPTASCSKKGLGKNSHYTSFALSKATDLGLICLPSFYGNEISGSQEVIEIGAMTTVVVREAPEEIFATFRSAST